MEDLYSNFTIAISRLNKVIQKIKTYEIGKYGLKPIHVSCCYYLSKQPGLTAKELAKLSLEDKAAVSRALKTMQEKGLVEYEPKGRNEAVKLTEAGQRLAEIIREKTNVAVEAGSAKITKEQRKFFYNSLIEISNKLINYYQELLEAEGKNE